VNLGAVVAGAADAYYSTCGSKNSSNLLTYVRRNEIRQIIQGMLDGTKAEIDAKMTEWGLKPASLTEGQVAELKQLKRDLRQSGASREEAEAAIDDKLKEWRI